MFSRIHDLTQCLRVLSFVVIGMSVQGCASLSDGDLGTWEEPGALLKTRLSPSETESEQFAQKKDTAEELTVEVSATKPQTTPRPGHGSTSRHRINPPISSHAWNNVDLKSATQGQADQISGIVTASDSSVVFAHEDTAGQSILQTQATTAEPSLPDTDFLPPTVAEPPMPALDAAAPNPQIAVPLGPVRIPLAGNAATDDINLTMKNGRVTLVTRNASVQSVLNLLAEQQGLNLITAEDVTGNISVTLTDVPFDDALNSIVAIAGCTWNQQRGIMLVSKIESDLKGSPGVQGRVVQVFPLNFVSAVDIELTVKGLMSPIGQVFISQTSPTDKRRTQESVVVEDIPASVARVAEYIQQVDQAPRQVLIEAHILEVDLKDDTRHGVDWKYITKLADQKLTVGTTGFANPAANPASIFALNGAKLNLVVEALQSTTDSKTLANPKVIVANGQEARIQIGAKLGYFVTTTTQTSTLQNVNFLNTGVLLRVTPQISNDNRVLLVVRPEISTGKISSLGLPETNTTEAETTVLMEDGGGMVIGGLIKETDVDTQDKIPYLGDIWLVGRFFQKRSTSRARSEIVIVLIPRIAPYSPDLQEADNIDIERTTTPLFQTGLQPAPRPLDPRLPDAIANPRRLRFNRLPALFTNPYRSDPAPLPYYVPTADEEQFPPSRD